MTAIKDELTAPATADLVRSVPFELVREDGDAGDGLTFRGYAAVFNETTTIDSWEGRFLEQVAPGAFKKSLRERTPVFQFDHGTHPLIGSIPLGRLLDTREDEHGVYVEARLEDNWLVAPVRDAIASGTVSGMSFRFEVVRDRWEDRDGKVLKDPREIIERIYSSSDDDLLTRTLLEVKSRELGPVVFPAYPGTEASVRSTVTLDLARMNDPEQRSALAAAIYAADRAESPATTDSPATPEGTAPAAADHETRETEAPQATSTAGEHATENAQDDNDLRARIAQRRKRNAVTITHAEQKEVLR